MKLSQHIKKWLKKIKFVDRSGFYKNVETGEIFELSKPSLIRWAYDEQPYYRYDCVSAFDYGLPSQAKNLQEEDVIRQMNEGLIVKSTKEEYEKQINESINKAQEFFYALKPNTILSHCGLYKTFDGGRIPDYNFYKINRLYEVDESRLPKDCTPAEKMLTKHVVCSVGRIENGEEVFTLVHDKNILEFYRIGKNLKEGSGIKYVNND